MSEEVKKEETPVADSGPDVNPAVAALLADPEVARAYEAHREKSPVKEGDDGQRASLADSIVQYLVIMRDEKVGYASDAKNAEKQIVHSAGGNLFVGLKAYEIVTAAGRKACAAAIVSSKLSSRELALALQGMSMTLANAPRVEGVDVAGADIGVVIDALMKRAKTKDELAALLKSILK